MNRNWYYACIGLSLLALLLRQPLLLVVGLLGLLVLITADLWGKYCLSHLRFSRELSEKRVLFGEEITLSVAVENAKLLPLPWLEIEDVVPAGLYIQGHHLRIHHTTNRTMLENLFSPRWYERVTRRYTVSCTMRGVHTFGPTQMRSGDLFGFTEREEEFDQRQYLIVYPLIVPLSSFRLPARYPFGDRRAPRRLLEDPSRVIGVRDYAYGDDLRRVHWKATARTMQLQSKVYEATTTYTLVTFLNMAVHLDMYFGIHPELQELAVCAAASVSDWALNEGYSVGLYTNSMMYMPELGMALPEKHEQNGQNGSEQQEGVSLEAALDDMRKQRRIHIPPASHEEQRKRIMEALARVQGYFGTPIEALIQSERSRLPAGATIVIITSTVSDPLLDSLARLKQAGHAVTILLVGDQPIGGQLAGLTVYHLGGEEMWQKLIASHTPSEEATSSAQPAQQVVPVGFQL